MGKSISITVEQLKKLEPLSSLSDERLEELVTLSYVEKMPIGVSIFHEGDIDNHKDLVARVGVSPFEKRGPDILKGLHLGVSTSYGEQDVDYPDDRDSIWNKGEWKTAGDTEFAEYNDGVAHDGHGQQPSNRKIQAAYQRHARRG